MLIPMPTLGRLCMAELECGHRFLASHESHDFLQDHLKGFTWEMVCFDCPPQTFGHTIYRVVQVWLF
jgi:hypothetical protein